MILKGKNAVITGGSRGIGFAVAEKLAKEGCNLLLVSRTSSELEVAKSKLEVYKIRVEIFAGDVGSENDVASIAQIVKEKFGEQLDILVNAAGIYGPIGPIIDNDPKEWRRVIDINLVGTFLMIRAIVPIMKKSGGGKIVNFVGGGEGALPNFSGYASSKGAIAHLNETAAAELKNFRIDVNAIAPGAVNTKFLENLLAAGQEKVGGELYEKSLRQKQEGGVSPEKAANLVLFLVSDESSGISGKIFSAIWDPYRRLPSFKEEIINSDVYTFRRLKPTNPLLRVRQSLPQATAHFSKIAIFGLWHLWEIYSAGLAELGHQVIGISKDAEVVANLSKNIPPLAEPKLAVLVEKNRLEGRLSYTTDFSKVAGCDVFWLALDTPIDQNDNPDTAPLFAILGKAIPYFREGILIVVSSQLPVGVSRQIQSFIKKNKPGLKFDYVYSPENLRLGEGVDCFFNADRILVGTDSSKAFEKMEQIFSNLGSPLLKMSPESAELAKHALNSFLATSLSFANDIADVAERTGADMIDVKKALVSDPRVGPFAYLDPGLGFSGGTLGRDLMALLGIAKESAIHLPLIRSALEKNLNRKNLVIHTLKKELNSLVGKMIAIFGLTYKSGTPTMRRSLAIEIGELIKNEGGEVRMFDANAYGENIYRDFYRAAEGASAIIIMTPGPELREINFQKLKKIAPFALIFDAKNFFWQRESEIISLGFKYIGIGRPH